MTEGARNPVGQWLSGFSASREGGEAGCGRAGEALGRPGEGGEKRGGGEGGREGGLEEEDNQPVKFTSVPGS